MNVDLCEFNFAKVVAIYDRLRDLFAKVEWRQQQWVLNDLAVEKYPHYMERDEHNTWKSAYLKHKCKE